MKLSKKTNKKSCYAARMFVLCFYSVFMIDSVTASEVFFSCSTSIGVASLYEDKNMLFYSMEKSSSPVFLFSSAKDKYEGFTYNKYFRYQTEYVHVNFFNKGFEYSIFSSMEDDEIQQGVTVINLKNGREYNYFCKEVFVDKLIALSRYLSCDKQSSLGCS